MTGASHSRRSPPGDLTRRFIGLALLLASVMLPFDRAHADESADLARIIELNEEYAAATRMWRAGEVSRAEMQARQKAVQSEARRIHSSYGRTGSPERREWDRKVAAAKNAHTKAVRQEAKALAPEQRAAERADAQAAAAERRALAEEQAALQARKRAAMWNDIFSEDSGML
jgi:hypothetical protein